MEHIFTADDLENSYKNLMETLYSHIHTLATFNIGGIEDAELGDDIDHINQLLFI